jgi:peptidoglycan/LPS O-acetylase OafA/YrhL
LNPDQILGRILEWNWLRWIGRLSYSLYLWQQLFLVPYNNRVSSLGRLQDWPFNLLAALICAVASYYLVERFFIKLGHKLARPVSEGRLT